MERTQAHHPSPLSSLFATDINPSLLSSTTSQLPSVSWKLARGKHPSLMARTQHRAGAGPFRACHGTASSDRPVPGGGSSSHDTASPNPSDDQLSSLDRRQLLLGSSSLGIAGGLPALWLPPAAFSSPVRPPDLKQCTTPIDPGNGAPPVDCCVPPSATISDYKLPSTKLPLRTRPSAHLAPPAYIAKYNHAYQLLRQLPASDPRQYAQQAKVHCANCDGAYDEGGTTIEYQVHGSWLFLAWHRWYLYFHERILASLIKDDTFALPFWNYDDVSGYTIPPMYTNSTSPLYNANRNPLHKPPAVVDVNYNLTESGLTSAQQLAANNTVMYRQIVSNSKLPSLFFGLAYRQGDAPGPGAGAIENVPHGTVHDWTGNPANPNNEDMGALYSAARDPIFYAHHSNIDRLWEVWKSLGGRRKDIKDKDYLDATFLFYDENAKLVRVRIGDALDTTKLGYKYQNVPNSWLNAAPTPTSMTGARAAIVRDFKVNLKEFKERKSNKIENTVSALVKRPKKVRAVDNEEEILVLEGVEIPMDERVKFDVYINLQVDAKDDKIGYDVSEYAGSFFNLPHMGGMKMGGGKRLGKSNFRIGIGEVLKELDIEDDDDFAITIVPRGKTSIAISVDGVKIEYE